MGLESVGGLVIHIILLKLGPVDTAVLCCLSQRFRAYASDDSVWSKFCSDDLHLSSPLDPLGNPAPSFQVAYRLWREAFGMYPWSLFKRVKGCWGRLTSWLAINFPEALATLRRGASEDEINEVEKHLKVRLPLPTRVLYRFYDGQDIYNQDWDGSRPGSLLGIIGGYEIFDHLVNVSLLPLKQIIIETKNIRRLLRFGSTSKYIVVAASATYSKKVFFLDCKDGQLHVGTRNLATDVEMLPCVPNALINAVHNPRGNEQQDAMLLWLEEHTRRLENGIIKLREDGKFRSINLFPEQPPFCSTAVANGVQVRASAVLVPEFSDLQEESEKYLFAYSIRLWLLPEGCVINGMCFSSCQLHWRHWTIHANGRRHWIIHANDRVVSDVNGEAVIGEFPLLLAGEKESVYETFNMSLSSSLGSMEGSFTFVPGRLADPKGAQFEVEVAKFPLRLPDYIF